MKNNLTLFNHFWKISISGLIAGLLLLPDAGFGQIKRVWAVDDGEKIRRDDIDYPLAGDKNNAVWKNKTISIFGARNEIVAFQLIIQADVSGAKNVNVVISNLKSGSSIIPGSATGPADPFDYRGRNVELFTEHYLNITKRSLLPGFFWQVLHHRPITQAGSLIV